MKKLTHSMINQNHQKGFSLIEVLVAAAVFAFGLIALAVLHINLNQASADARAASNASQVATQVLEDARAFVSIAEYDAIGTTEAQRFVREGVEMTATQEVRRFRYNPNPDNDPATADGIFEEVGIDEVFDSRQPEFKQVTVNVSWTGADGSEKTVALADAISSAIPQDGLAIARRQNGERINPRVRIRESTETGVIPIAVGEDDAGNDIASASTNPRPKQYAEGATGTTKFTVDTYIRDQTNPLLQRQLDFAYASCVCKRGAASTSLAPAYEPTYWDGVRYVSPKPVVGKPTGVRDTGVDQDPQLCDTCCRDHHDELSAAVKMDPFRAVNDYTSGSHNHYKTGATVGTLALAGANDSYLESCRMVRVDGIYQVATDTRLENLALLRLANANGTPVLNKQTSDAYASFAAEYVKQAAQARTQNAAYPIGGLPNALGTPEEPTTLAQTYELAVGGSYIPQFLDQNRDNALVMNKEQTAFLNARGLYIDWISPQAIEKIECIGNTDDAECAPYADMELLELTPFVAVNLTQLALWGSEDPTVATVRNDPIPLVRSKTDTFVRGQVTALNDGEAAIIASIQRSNSGLINTKAIDPQDLNEAFVDQEEVDIGNAPAPVDAAPFKIIINDGTGDRNFSIQNVAARMSSPEMAQPQCAVGTTQKTVNERNCTLTDSGEPLVLTFSNFNYYTCTHLGNKWVFDSVNVQCVLPPSGKEKNPTYGTPQVRDYQLCSVTGPIGAVSISGVSTSNNGAVNETASVSISRNGALTLLETLAGLGTPQFTATFGTTCN